MPTPKSKLTSTLCIALTFAAFGGVSAANAQAYGPGPTYIWDSQARGSQRPEPERYCGAGQADTAPDIMTYDRRTKTEVMVGSGAAPTAVTGINRESGSSFSVQGDLRQGTPYVCTADAKNQRGYVIAPGPDGTQVRGYDGAAGRRFEVKDGRELEYKGVDLAHGTGTVATVGPDGRAYARAFNGERAIFCTQRRIGQSGFLSVHTPIGGVDLGPAGVSLFAGC